MNVPKRRNAPCAISTGVAILKILQHAWQNVLINCRGTPTGYGWLIIEVQAFFKNRPVFVHKSEQPVGNIYIILNVLIREFNPQTNSQDQTSNELSWVSQTHVQKSSKQAAKGNKTYIEGFLFSSKLIFNFSKESQLKANVRVLSNSLTEEKSGNYYDK